MPTKPHSKVKEARLIEQGAKCCLIEWGLCLMPEVPLTLTCSAQTYATWEHLTPRVRGGSGARANLRLSHKKCNNARRDAPLPGYQETPAVPVREPFVLPKDEPEPMPFSEAWLRWKGYL